MLKTILKTVVCAGALLIVASAIETTPAEAGSRKIRAPMNFSKSMRFRKSPAIRAFRAQRPSRRLRNIRRFKPKRSFARTNRLRAISPRQKYRFRRNARKFAIGRLPDSKKALGSLSPKPALKSPFAINRNSDLAKVLRDKSRKSFTYGGTYRTSNGPLQFVGSRANKRATLSPSNLKNLGAPWQRNVPEGSGSKSSGASNLAFSRKTDLGKVLATFGSSNASGKRGAIGPMYRGVPAYRLNKDLLKLYKQKSDCFEFDCFKGKGAVSPSKFGGTASGSGKYNLPNVLSRPELFSGETSKAETATKANPILSKGSDIIAGRNTLGNIFGGTSAGTSGIITTLSGPGSRLQEFLNVGGHSGTRAFNPSGFDSATKSPTGLGNSKSPAAFGLTSSGGWNNPFGLFGSGGRGTGSQTLTNPFGVPSRHLAWASQGGGSISPQEAARKWNKFVSDFEQRHFHTPHYDYFKATRVVPGAGPNDMFQGVRDDRTGNNVFLRQTSDTDVNERSGMGRVLTAIGEGKWGAPYGLLFTHSSTKNGTTTTVTQFVPVEGRTNLPGQTTVAVRDNESGTRVTVTLYDDNRSPTVKNYDADGEVTSCRGSGCDNDHTSDASGAEENGGAQPSDLHASDGGTPSGDASSSSSDGGSSSGDGGSSSSDDSASSDSGGGSDGDSNSDSSDSSSNDEDEQDGDKTANTETENNTNSGSDDDDTDTAKDDESQPRDCAADWTDGQACRNPEAEMAAMKKALEQLWGAHLSTVPWRYRINLHRLVNPNPEGSPRRPIKEVTKADTEAAKKKKRDQVTNPNPLGSPSHYISEEEARERTARKLGELIYPDPTK